MVSPLLPLLLSAAYMGEPERPSSLLLDQDFGQGLRPEQLVLSRYGYYVPWERLLRDGYFRPWAELLRPENGGGVSSVSLDEKRFRVILDVQQFKPEEVEVKLVGKYVVVSAKHEEKKDEHGFVSRQFERRYVLPESVEADGLASSISSDGVLTIEAPVKRLPEHKIKIEYTGKPALKRAETEKEVDPSSTTAESAESSSSTTQSSTTPDK